MYELDIWKILYSQKLILNILRYLRFRDDVRVHVGGASLEISRGVKISITGYPKEIQFNVERI